MIEVGEVPVFCNVLWPSPEEARAAQRADIDLVRCRRCNHLFNDAFDPSLVEYSPTYENSLHFSDRFNSYARHLAQRLVEGYNLRGKDIVELGCGRGDFLRLLCELGGNRGVGFDPSRSSEANPQGGVAGSSSLGTISEVRFVNDHLTLGQPTLPVDFLCCRHVLEHLAEPLAFLTELRVWLGEDRGAVTYFEVPNALHTVERGGIWDLIYEHHSYFSVQSLVSLFIEAGFSPHSWGEAFGGQYLFVLAGGESGAPEGVSIPPMDREAFGASIASFRPRFQTEVRRWLGRMEDAAVIGDRLALWGGGSKGVTFLNFLDPCSTVPYVVDQNPYKHGRFLPGAGHEVVPPARLAADPPDGVIVTNSLYLDEIRAEIAHLGVDAETYLV